MDLPAHSGIENPHTSKPEPTPLKEDEAIETGSTRAAQERSRGMSTGQMVVLWYAVVLLEVILVAVGGSADSEAGAALSGASAVVLLAGALIYSLRPHPAANKSKVARVVVIPVCSTAVIACAVAGVVAWRQSRVLAARIGHQIPVSAVETYDERMDGYGTVTGWIKNNSGLQLEELDYRVRATNTKGDVAYDTRTKVECSVAPGEARRFRLIAWGLGVDSGGQTVEAWYGTVEAARGHKPGE